MYSHTSGFTVSAETREVNKQASQGQLYLMACWCLDDCWSITV